MGLRENTLNDAYVDILSSPTPYVAKMAIYPIRLASFLCLFQCLCIYPLINHMKACASCRKSKKYQPRKIATNIRVGTKENTLGELCYLD